MFRKIIKGLKQNLSIIYKDSIQQLFLKIPENMMSVIPWKTLIAGSTLANFDAVSQPWFVFGIWQIFSQLI